MRATIGQASLSLFVEIHQKQGRKLCHIEPRNHIEPRKTNFHLQILNLMPTNRRNDFLAMFLHCQCFQVLGCLSIGSVFPSGESIQGKKRPYLITKHHKNMYCLHNCNVVFSRQHMSCFHITYMPYTLYLLNQWIVQLSLSMAVFFMIYWFFQ